MSDELFDWVAVAHPDEDCKIIALVERKQTGCGPDGDFANGFCTIWSSGASHSAAELARLFIAVPDMLAVCRALDESAPLDSEYGTCGCCDMRNRHESDCAVILARAAIAKATSPADKASAL